MILWASDLHVKPARVYRKRTLSDDAFYALDQIESIAIERGVSHVILGGDVTDSSMPCGETLNRLAKFVRVLGDQGIVTLYIEGNHDRINRNPYLSEEHYHEHRLLSSIGATPLGTQTIGNLKFHGIDYSPVQKLHEKLEAVPECDILCLHAGFRHMLGFEGAYDLEKSHIPDTVGKLVLVGHVHVHEESGASNGVKILSSGSTWVWKISETEAEHGVFLIDEDASHEFVALNTRKYFDVTEEQDIIDTIAEEHVLRPVLHYDPEQMQPDHEKYPEVILIHKVADAEEEEAKDLEEHAVASLQDALVVAVSPDEYPLEYAFLKATLDSPDPKAFVRDHLKTSGVTPKQGVTL